jgi:hypothetical protein
MHILITANLCGKIFSHKFEYQYLFKYLNKLKTLPILAFNKKLYLSLNVTHTYLPLEPVGGSAPKFSSGAIEQLKIGSSTPTALLCSAQGAPTPGFR